MKTTGKELKAFWNDKGVWTEGDWVDSFYVNLNGEDTEHMDVEKLEDSDVVTIHEGVFVRDRTQEDWDLKVIFRRWRKKQTMATVVCEVPNDKVDDLKAFLKTIKGKAL